MTRVYDGYRDSGGNPHVVVDGKILSPKKSLRLWKHSPTGFEWGYCGSGPAQLALALLLDATGEKQLAVDYHQQLKSEVVAGWEEWGWTVSAVSIRLWVEKAKAEDVVDLSRGPNQ